MRAVRRIFAHRNQWKKIKSDCDDRKPIGSHWIPELKSLLRAVWAAAPRLEAINDDIYRAADGDVAGVDADRAFILRDDPAANDRPEKRELIAHQAVDLCCKDQVGAVAFRIGDRHYRA